LVPPESIEVRSSNAKTAGVIGPTKKLFCFTENKPFIETVLFNRKGDIDCESIEPKSVKVYFSISSVLPVQMGGPFI
jgi:hypothetical protein